jgi:16S rRNA (uracil1498-N3)-methyltransferase
MAVRDFTSQRLYLDAPLVAGGNVTCTSEQASYLRSVLRLPAGAELLVFNGREGEWRARLLHDGKRGASLEVLTQTRPQETGPDLCPDLWYVFAPLKRARLDYMVQKAVEMGASRLVPVLTQHTQAERVNLDRMQANVIEAAEQCGILRIPEVAEPAKLANVLASWPVERHLIFCDEGAARANPIEALRKLPAGPLAVLIGPEGGFSEAERTQISGKPFTHAISLGPRIMRADTAAVAALAVVQAVLGDWR